MSAAPVDYNSQTMDQQRVATDHFPLLTDLWYI